MSELGKVIIHSLDHNHCLSVLIDSQSIILYTFCCHINFRQLTDLGKDRIIARSRFPNGRNNLYLWIKVCEKRCYKIVKAIEST